MRITSLIGTRVPPPVSALPTPASKSFNVVVTMMTKAATPCLVAAVLHLGPVE